MVTDIFRGLGRKRGEAPTPLEELDHDSLCARLGLSPDAPPTSPPAYVRIDGPRPAEPRTWRANTDGTPR